MVFFVPCELVHCFIVFNISTLFCINMHIFISLMLNIEIVRDVGSRAIFWASLAIVAISFGMQDCESDVGSPSKLLGACLF